MSVDDHVWITTDRDDLRRGCERLASAGGWLVAVGDYQSGRDEAGQIAESIFTAAGLLTRRVLDAGNVPDTVRDILTDLGEWIVKLSGGQDLGLGVDASNTGVSLAKHAKLTAEALLSVSCGARQFGIVIHVAGQDPVAQIDQLRSLSERVGGAWLVVCGDAKSWESILHCPVIELRLFTRREVASALRDVLRKLSRDVSDVPDRLDRQFGPGIDAISPMHAYAFLQKTLYSGGVLP